MADVFISYKKEERALTEMLESAFAAHQLSVWWDRSLAGGDAFRTTIETELGKAGAVVVIWSPLAVTSNFILDEASEAAGHKKLVPVCFTPGFRPPMGFREIQSHDLVGWTGDPKDPRILQLVDQIDQVRSRRMGAAVADMGSALAGAVTSARTSSVDKSAAGLASRFLAALAFVSVLGLPVYRLLFGAAAMTIMLVAIWLVPAILEERSGGGQDPLLVGFFGVLFARLAHQAGTIVSGGASRQFFDKAFSFWTCLTAIAAPVGLALLLPMPVSPLAILNAFPGAFTTMLSIAATGRALALAIGRLAGQTMSR